MACQIGFNEGGSSPRLGVVTNSFRSGNYQRLTDCGARPVWFPDSRRILFVSRGNDFIVLDSRSKTVHPIFLVERDSIGTSRMTRDVRSIYFTRRITEADIRVVTLR